MKLKQLPVVAQVVESGAEDRVFDGLLFVGPIVLLVIALFGRSVITQGLAVGYVTVFVAHVLRNFGR